ncbi:MULTISPECIES: hypothetical protein [Bacillus cereus group]|uniref:Uncharacterized protein n=1 Tax=Bacillus cereus TaxID=1396 RepID=A0A9X6VWB8_BACCE|nr:MULTISPECIES: hypothetical protein [Bacillus cereus group]PFF46108.1 hypothetical protein CN357_21930 [Bacillus cereus]PFQ36418.1 hypothetical protein COK33_16730 [Bacillus cereus]PGB17961.1 hypothetical protein COM09_04035 [Bacillus toyonensis]
MIPFNLKEDDYKNHPLDGKYGTIITNSIYANCPVTIVDNHEEVINGKYTKNPALCLLHLSEDVRQYMSLRLFDDFLYKSFVFDKSLYRIYEYKKETLSDEKIIEILKNVFYLIQPTLQSHSLVGSKSKRLEDDPNYYEGYYVLNDEEEYTILKCRDSYKFYKGRKTYYPNWENTQDEDLLYEGLINFDIYKISIEVEQLRGRIVRYTNQILDDEHDDSIQKYKDLKKQLKASLKEVVNL